MKPRSPALQADSLQSEPPGKPQEHFSRLLFPPPEDLPDPGMEPVSLASQALTGEFFFFFFFNTALPGKTRYHIIEAKKHIVLKIFHRKG